MVKRKGFSLMELMVVIGIIALLATMAAPYYGDYVNKSKVAMAALVLNDLNSKAMALFNDGTLTASSTGITVSGHTFEDNTPIAYDSSPVVGASFIAPTNGDLNDNAWMFCVYVGDLNFHGYVEGVPGAYSRLCSLVVADNSIFHTYCGTWTSIDNGVEIPANYLPPECDDTSISDHA